MRFSRIKQDNSSSGVDRKHTENNIRCLLSFIHRHMIDPALNKIIPSCHRSGVTIPIWNCIGGRCPVGVIAWLGISTCEVSSFTTVAAPSISRPLDSLLSLHILASWGSGLSDVGALYEQLFWSLVALHGHLGSLLELSSGLLLRCTLDRSGRWYS
jgi:hypothetical protein